MPPRHGQGDGHQHERRHQPTPSDARCALHGTSRNQSRQAVRRSGGQSTSRSARKPMASSGVATRPSSTTNTRSVRSPIRRRTWSRSWVTHNNGEAPGDEVDGQVLDGPTGVGVERRGGLVHEQHLGLGQQRPGDAGPLRLASRQVVAGAIEERAVQHDPLEHAGEALVGAVRVGHQKVVADRAGEEGRPLEHHAHPAPMGQRVEVGHVLPPEPHQAARRHLEPVAQPQQGRLARSRRSHQHGDAPAGHGGVDPGQDRLAPRCQQRHVHELEARRRGIGVVPWGHPGSMPPRHRAPAPIPRAIRGRPGIDQELFLSAAATS